MGASKTQRAYLPTHLTTPIPGPHAPTQTLPSGTDRRTDIASDQELATAVVQKVGHSQTYPELFAVILGCRMRENGHLGDGNHVPGYETPQGWGFLSGGPDDCAIACNHDPRCAAWTLHLP